jgi:hypothetical protein
MNGRIHGRFSIERDIQCHINDVAEWVFLYDLSAGGCMIEVGSIKVAVGDLVRLNLYDFAKMAGTVAWKSDKNAGVRFDGLLSDAILAHLGFSSSSVGFDELMPRDRFGELIGQAPEKPEDVIPVSAEAPSDPDPQLGDLLESAHLQEDRRAQDRDEPARRREERLEVDAKAKLSLSVRDGFEGRLADLSANGCSFLDSSGAFKPGTEVWLKIGSLERWKGTVRWVNEDRVGVEFERPFHPAVFDHLVQSNPVAVCVTVA